MPELHNEPCACAADYCAHFVEPPGSCINRVTGDVRTALCPVCRAMTWHRNGECLACQHREARAAARNEGER